MDRETLNILFWLLLPCFHFPLSSNMTYPSKIIHVDIVYMFIFVFTFAHINMYTHMDVRISIHMNTHKYHHIEIDINVLIFLQNFVSCFVLRIDFIFQILSLLTMLKHSSLNVYILSLLLLSLQDRFPGLRLLDQSVIFVYFNTQNNKYVFILYNIHIIKYIKVYFSFFIYIAKLLFPQNLETHNLTFFTIIVNSRYYSFKFFFQSKNARSHYQFNLCFLNYQGSKPYIYVWCPLRNALR